MSDGTGKKPVSDDELGEVTGGAGMRKATSTKRKTTKMVSTGKTTAKKVASTSSKQMMDIVCDGCGKTYSADVSRSSSTCPFCSHTATFCG